MPPFWIGFVGAPTISPRSFAPSTASVSFYEGYLVKPYLWWMERRGVNSCGGGGSTGRDLVKHRAQGLEQPSIRAAKRRQAPNAACAAMRVSDLAEAKDPISRDGRGDDPDTERALRTC